MRNLLTQVVVLLLLSYSCLAQTQIDRGPYLQLATTNSITIQWRTEAPTQSIVWYGNSVGDLNQSVQNTSLNEDHSIQLTGLNTNTTYYYAVGDASGMLAGNNEEFYFKTHPVIGSTTPFRAWIQGDAGVGTQVQRDTRNGFLSYLGEDGTMDLMLMLGDNAYSDGKQSEYQDALFNDMYGNIMNKVVLWPTLGNHDSYSTDSEDRTGPYYDIFTLPKNGEAGGTPSGTEAYYSYDYANVHFLVLNSHDVDLDPAGEMAQWIATDMANSNQDWMVAYFHHPIYSGAHNNESDNNNRETLMRENILPVLEAGNVDLVLFGHTHNYQRSFLLKAHYGSSNTFDPATMAVDDGTGRLSDETPYVKLNGDSGAVFVCMGNAAKLEDEPEEDLQHPTTIIGRDLRGSVAMEVNGDQLDFKFILQDGTIEDHFTMQKAINPLSIIITHPGINAHYPNLQNIPITTVATDPEGGVTQVEFFINGSSIGIDYNAPFNINWHPLHAGAYTIKAVATDTDGFTKSDSRNITVGQTTTSCVQINSGTDDAEERENGSVNLSSGDLELIEDSNDDQVVGLRFNNLNIPHGAAISNAVLNFKVKNDANENPCLLIIHGQVGNNTNTFSTNNSDISSRPKTNNSLTWAPSNWETSGALKSTTDIGAILQEIVLQDAYVSNQSIVLIIEGIGSRNAIAFDQGDGSEAPELCITFDAENCLDSDFDSVCDINDICPGIPDPGQPCNDNNPGTFNDIADANCNCQGTPYDCPNLQAQFGTPCNDGNGGTYDDIITENCECQGTPYDCPDLQVQFGTPCNDNDPGTFDDRIDMGCDCEGTPYDCPDLQLQFGAACNDNNIFTCYDIITTDCNCAGTLTAETTTLSSQIDQDSDDAEERSNGSVNITSGDLELIQDNSDQVVGLRFDNPGIDADANITDAYVQFTVDETNNINPCELLIYGELNTAANTFSTNSNNISSRIKTAASISWTPDDWEDVDDNGLAQRTPNLSPILQEIMALSGYATGSPIVIIIEGNGKRVAISHDKSSNDAAILNVSYELSLDDADGDGICDAEDPCFGPNPGTACNDNNVGTYNDLVNENCQCAGTAYDCPVLNVNIGSPCNDGNNGTFNDAIDANCNCTGSLFECPALSANIGDACNDGNSATINDVVNANCNCAGTPLTTIEICDQVSNDADDAEEKPSGNCSTSSSDLELAEDNGDLQLIGIRFRNIELQQGTLVSESYIQFTADNIDNINPCELTIRGQLHPDPAVFERSSNNISDRSLTTASVNWSPQDWESSGDADAAQRSPDLSIILQEIVNQESFDENSAVVFIISGEGLRQAVSHDENGNEAAELCVSYYESTSSAMMAPVANTIVQKKEGKEEDATTRSNDNEIGSLLQLFPNPANAMITAVFNNSTEGLAKLVILDTNGRVLSQEEHPVISGNNQISLNSSDLPNGVYFLTLQTNDERLIAKFSILR